MKAAPPDFRRFEFHFPKVDMRVRVEVADGRVTVRASRNAFDERRKDSFIRELAAEGFIPESNRWKSLTGGRGVRWIIDRSWMGSEEPTPEVRRRSALRLFSGAALATALLMSLLFSGNLGHFRVGPAPMEQHH